MAIWEPKYGDSQVATVTHYLNIIELKSVVIYSNTNRKHD